MTAERDRLAMRMPRHDHGCNCWPHVSEKEALALIADVATLEYREGRDARSAAYDDGWERGRADLAARIEERLTAEWEGRHYRSEAMTDEVRLVLDVARRIVREEAAR